MKSQHLSISFAEFERRPKPFGWKAEYYDNKLHLTPRENAIKTKLNIQARNLETTHLIQPIDVKYKSKMIKGFYEAFGDSVEFCDWTKKDILHHAENNINDYFAGIRGQPLPQSVMALEPETGQLIGLALVLISRKQHYKLDLLFVKPNYQQQGLATAMVSAITAQLHKLGVSELYSLYHICNQSSRQWHQRFGFQEEYNMLFMRLKLAWYRDEMRRQEVLGLTEALPELIREKEYWSAQLADKNSPQDYWWDDD